MSSKAQISKKDYERGLRIADRRKEMGLSQDEFPDLRNLNPGM